jgi:hypothetical protein
MLTMTCLWEYEMATVEDRTHYWRRVASEGDPESKLRKWIEKQPEDVPLAKLVTLAVDALESKQLDTYQWLTEYFKNKCPSRRNQMTVEQAIQEFDFHYYRGNREEVISIHIRENRWQAGVQTEIGYRGCVETWRYFEEHGLYGNLGPMPGQPITRSVVIGICKAGHTVWLQDVLRAGFADLEYCMLWADNVELLHDWYEAHGRPPWSPTHCHLMIQSGAMRCLRYYLANGGLLEHNCIIAAFCGSADTCAIVVPFLVEHGATWDESVPNMGFQTRAMHTQFEPWLEYLREQDRQRQAQ